MKKCKIRTAAEREHDAPEMPAHAFRLVNTSVFSTSAFSMMLKKACDFVSCGIICQTCVCAKTLQKTREKLLLMSTLKNVQKNKHEPTNTP